MTCRTGDLFAARATQENVAALRQAMKPGGAPQLKAGLRAEHFSPAFHARRFRSIEVKGAMPVGGAVVDEPLGWTVAVAG